MKKLVLAAACALTLAGVAEARSNPPAQRPVCYSFLTIWLFRIPIRIPCEPPTEAPRPPRAGS